MGGCLWLTGLGGLLEIIGLGLVVIQLTRVQRRDLGTPRWIQWVRARWRRLVGRDTTVHLTAVDAAVATEAAIGVRVRRGPGQTLEERVAALEANLAELDQDTDGRFTDMEQRLTATHQRVNEVRGYMDQLRREQEHERREELRESVTLQWWGTGLFVLGVVASLVGNAVSC